MNHNIAKGILLYRMLVYVVCSSRCTSDQYWDWITGACSWCTNICLQAEARNTAEECKQKCPNWTQQTVISTSGNIGGQTNGTNVVLPTYGIVLIVIVIVGCVVLLVVVILCYHRRVLDRKKCKCGKYFKKYCKVCRTLTQTGSARSEDPDQTESKVMLEEERPKEQRKQSPRLAHPQQNGNNDPTLPSGCSMTIKSIENITSAECTQRKESL